ncbi:hypothetical protein P2W49_11710 [Yersinia intermedia]|nr:hypothetical protein P2W49_11710 [Yersinia intermedia]
MDWQCLAPDIWQQFMAMTKSFQDSQSLAVKSASRTNLSSTTYECRR